MSCDSLMRRMLGFELEIPIRAHLRGAALLENEQMSRRQLHDVAEHRERRRNEAQREILIQCREIQAARRLGSSASSALISEPNAKRCGCAT